MADTCTRTPQIQQAKKTSVASCEHGTITIYLYDAAGKIFAAASYDPDQALALVSCVSDEIEHYLESRGAVLPAAEDPAGGRVH